jgi:hypothetical protein
MLKEAFGDNAEGQTQTYIRFKCFKNGRMSVVDDECSGQPLTRTMTREMWQECERLSWNTEDERFTTFVKLSDCSMAQCNKICAKADEQ